MRWSLWHRRGGSPGGAAPGGGASSAAAARGGAWREVHPLAPTLGAQPTAGSIRFARTLPSRWRQAPVLGQLGHDMPSEAPAGLISGLARSVAVDLRDTGRAVAPGDRGDPPGGRVSLAESVPRRASRLEPIAGPNPPAELDGPVGWLAPVGAA